MTENVTCPDCDVRMERGFVPEYGTGTVQSHWHKGKPKRKKALGVDIGVAVKRRLMKPIVCFRCPRCGLLRHYAP
jgi:hypothetical protein